MKQSDRSPATLWHSLLKISFLILLIIAANFASDWIADILKFELRPSNEDFVHRTVLASAIIYAFLIAIPFVPGVEIGLTLIGMFGPDIILLVYLSTFTGLMTAFIIGRCISMVALVRFLKSFHLLKASRLLESIEPLKMEDRLAFLVASTPSRLIPFLLRHRYVALAILVNLPGNILIGGGGGISLIAGTSRLFSYTGFLTTIVFAISPVPLAVLLFGTEFLAR